jgi:nicotinamide-nucleotide amidase
MGVELEFYEDVYRQMEEFFARRDLSMAETNRIQAYLPKGAKAMANELGTAAGIMCQYEGTVFVSMPGVPTEMKQMFADSVFPMFGDGDMAIVSRRLHCFGTGESRIAEMLGDTMERGRNPLVNCTVSGGIITLEVSARAQNRLDAEKMAAADVEKLYAILADVVFGTDGESMAQAVGKKLIAASKTIAVAESCTGGLLAKMLTDVAGASSYFTHGWVTYSNDAKVSELGVDRALIDAYGAVSGQVAMAMATAAKARSGADIGVGITGIAGPGGGSEQKPVGLVYISVDIDGQRTDNRYLFGSLRAHVRLRAALASLNMVRILL